MSPLAEKRWPSRSDSGEALLARAQQDLGRAERAGRQHDHVGASTHRGRRAAACRPGARRARASRHRRACATWRTLACVKISAPWRDGIGQIGQRHGVLGADVAAAAAVAAARAGRLRDAGRIDGRLEADRHGRRDRRRAQRAAGALAAPCTWCARPPRGSRAGRSQRSRPRVAFVEQAVLRDLAGPDADRRTRARRAAAPRRH